ncbi:hypothetical protein NSPZN2_50223 [Nitrospira defluvii]|uniref:Uncharacterized protein n=1 Tax=Nitrospira defluvii TaxID=330214 RepID=A0ABN7M6W6_9BACT|nr:hypothetical protein NSPZN2_50223 [Nitrospira defluvii]
MDGGSLFNGENRERTTRRRYRELRRSAAPVERARACNFEQRRCRIAHQM